MNIVKFYEERGGLEMMNKYIIGWLITVILIMFMIGSIFYRIITKEMYITQNMILHSISLIIILFLMILNKHYIKKILNKERRD